MQVPEQSQDSVTSKSAMGCLLQNNLDSSQKLKASVWGRSYHQCKAKSCTRSSGSWGREVETTPYNALAEKWETTTGRTVLAGQTNPTFIMFRAVLRQYAFFSICIYSLLRLKNLDSQPSGQHGFWRSTWAGCKSQMQLQRGQLQIFPCCLVTPPMCWMVLMERNGKAPLNPHH